MAVNGDIVYPTPDELRAIGLWAQNGDRITVLGYDEGYSNDQLLSSTNLSVSITPESAKTSGLRADDCTIELRIPTVNSTDCISQFDFPGLDFSHRDAIGIYKSASITRTGDTVGARGR